MLPGEVAAHPDAEPGAAAPPGLLGQLQGQALEAHDIVPADDPLVLLGQDVIEVDGVAEGHEGAGRIGRGAGELGVVVGDEVLAQIGVGRLERGDAGQAELVDEAALQGAIEPLDAAAGLGGVARDVLDAQAGEGPADHGETGAIDRAAGPGGVKGPAGAVGIQRDGQAARPRRRPAEPS